MPYLEERGRCSHRSPSCPDSTTSPSLAADNNINIKTTPFTYPPHTSPSALKNAMSEISNNLSDSTYKEKLEEDSRSPTKNPESGLTKLRVPNFPTVSPTHRLIDGNPYSTSPRNTGQLLGGGLPSMAVHTSPVALHLLSSYIAAGFVPQISGNHTLFSTRSGFTPVNPASTTPQVSGLAFPPVDNLMTTSAPSVNLHSQSISALSLEKVTSPNCLNPNSLNIPMASGLAMNTHNGFSTNIGLTPNFAAPALGTNDIHLPGSNNIRSSDIKRPIPHLPTKTPDVGIL